MTKFEVHIHGKVPDCLELDADSNDQAVDAAIQIILENLEFHAAPLQEKSSCLKESEANTP